MFSKNTKIIDDYISKGQKMKIVNLGSGSKGNSTFVQGKNTKILIDCGLSLADIENRLLQIGENAVNINAILVTHEHIDHIKSLQRFAKKYNTKIFAREEEWGAINAKAKNIPLELENSFGKNDFYVGDLTVANFELSHDANFCVGYSLFCDGAKFSIATDLGICPQNIVENLKGSNVVLLESNHDEKLLLNNPHYPIMLKKRILSSKGHLSNIASSKVIAELVGSTNQIILGHLSEENNNPLLAYNTVKQQLAKMGIVEGKNIFVDVAFQNKIGHIFEINKK